jgi:hypothetical protein
MASDEDLIQTELVKTSREQLLGMLHYPDTAQVLKDLNPQFVKLGEAGVNAARRSYLLALECGIERAAGVLLPAVAGTVEIMRDGDTAPWRMLLQLYRANPTDQHLQMNASAFADLVIALTLATSEADLKALGPGKDPMRPELKAMNETFREQVAYLERETGLKLFEEGIPDLFDE